MVGPSKLRHSKATIPKAWCPLLAHMALLIAARYKSLMLPGPGIKMVLFRKEEKNYDSNSKLQNLDMSIIYIYILILICRCVYIYIVYNVYIDILFIYKHLYWFTETKSDWPLKRLGFHWFGCLGRGMPRKWQLQKMGKLWLNDQILAFKKIYVYI